MATSIILAEIWYHQSRCRECKTLCEIFVITINGGSLFYIILPPNCGKGEDATINPFNTKLLQWTLLLIVLDQTKAGYSGEKVKGDNYSKILKFCVWYCKVLNILEWYFCFIHDLLIEREFNTPWNISILYYLYYECKLVVHKNCLAANLRPSE